MLSITISRFAASATTVAAATPVKIITKNAVSAAIPRTIADANKPMDANRDIAPRRDTMCARNATTVEILANARSRTKVATITTTSATLAITPNTSAAASKRTTVAAAALTARVRDVVILFVTLPRMTSR